MEVTKLETELLGKPFSFESGFLANLADGAVTVRWGDNVLLATAVMSRSTKPDLDFFPLTVEYQEKFYASGKIPGGRFMKREGRPSDTAVLNSRLTDRPLRPLFPDGMINEVQIIVTPLSIDTMTDLGALSIIAASAAISRGGIPFEAPVAAARIGMINGELILNPTNEQEKNGQLDLVVAGTEDAILMVEAGASIVSEEIMIKGMEMAHEFIKQVCKLQKEFIAKFEIKPLTPTFNLPDEAVIKAVHEFIEQEGLIKTLYVKTKRELNEAENALKEKVQEHFKTKLEDENEPLWTEKYLGMAVFKVLKKMLRKNLLEKDERLDGRKLNEIRPITCTVGVLPRPHGSAVFQRGDTQALSVVTLGAPGDAQTVDQMEGEEYERRYMHHYNMPPYSTGEAKPLRGTGRREIGHGYLAERALLAVLPEEKDFPYTIRVVSEVVTSNGSTSMASTCGSTLSLMDAGVPLKAPVSGIAMGMVSDDETGNYKILSDIQGMEDFTGDMDFKVAGTKDGITALQMDMKVKGLTMDTIRKALSQAQEGRMFILGEMLKVLPEPRKQLSQYAPKIISMQINPEQIRDVIGSGGKIINEIIKETGVQIDIEDDGFVSITAPDQESGDRARKWIEGIVYIPQIGDVMEGKVVRIAAFGVFVNLGGKDGLVHISNLFPYRVDRIEGKVNIGDMMKVKVIGIDEQGKVALSHKEFETRA